MKITLKELKKIINKTINETPIESWSGETPVFSKETFVPGFEKTQEKYNFIHLNNKDIDYGKMIGFFNIHNQLYTDFIETTRNVVQELVDNSAIKMPSGIDFRSIPKDHKIVLINSSYFTKDKYTTVQAIKHDISHSLIDMTIIERKIYKLILGIRDILGTYFGKTILNKLLEAIFGPHYLKVYEDDQLPNFISHLIDISSDQTVVQQMKDEMSDRLSYENLISQLSNLVGKQSIPKINTLHQNSLLTKLNDLKKELVIAIDTGLENLKNADKVSMIGFTNRYR